ncbi:unnamed protein product, partial [Mesorhabditis spiculigera]
MYSSYSRLFAAVNTIKWFFEELMRIFENGTQGKGHLNFIHIGPLGDEYCQIFNMLINGTNTNNTGDLLLDIMNSDEWGEYNSTKKFLAPVGCFLKDWSRALMGTMFVLGLFVFFGVAMRCWFFVLPHILIRIPAALFLAALIYHEIALAVASPGTYEPVHICISIVAAIALLQLPYFGWAEYRLIGYLRNRKRSAGVYSTHTQAISTTHREEPKTQPWRFSKERTADGRTIDVVAQP